MIFQVTQSAHFMDLGRRVLRYEHEGSELTLEAIGEVLVHAHDSGAPDDALVKLQQRSDALVIRISWPKA